MVRCRAFDHLHRKIDLIRGELREIDPVGPFHDDLIPYLTNWSVPAASKQSMLVPNATLDLNYLFLCLTDVFFLRIDANNECANLLCRVDDVDPERSGTGNPSSACTG